MQATADEFRRERDGTAASGATTAAAASAADGHAKQLAEALEQLAAARAEMGQKEERWRLSSLKRHAEHSKLEATLKMAHESGEKLKKKADFLELALLSHQKSMDKDKARMIQASRCASAGSVGGRPKSGVLFLASYFWRHRVVANRSLCGRCRGPV